MLLCVLLFGCLCLALSISISIRFYIVKHELALYLAFFTIAESIGLFVAISFSYLTFVGLYDYLTELEATIMRYMIFVPSITSTILLHFKFNQIINRRADQ
jgi:hypothetical protein